MLTILISGLTAGLAVSLQGSDALCASEPLPPKWPSSTGQAKASNAACLIVSMLPTPAIERNLGARASPVADHFW